MCADNQADHMLVHINFASSGASVYTIIDSNGLAFNSKTGLTISFIGLSSGQKLHCQRLAGISTVSGAQAELIP